MGSGRHRGVRHQGIPDVGDTILDVLVRDKATCRGLAVLMGGVDEGALRADVRDWTTRHTKHSSD